MPESPPHDLLAWNRQVTRRQLLGRWSTGVGLAALATLTGARPTRAAGGRADLPHAAPPARRAIYLWQGGGPSHVDLFDYKPLLAQLYLQELPASVRSGARLSTMTAGYQKFPILPPIRPYRQYGQSGLWLSSLLPHIGGLADQICVIRSLHTEAVNHAPGVTFILTGSQIPGRPSLGAWLSYGLGSEADDLPTFVVMTSSDAGKTCGQLFFDYYWGSGFLPSEYQGVRFRSEGDPVPYLSNPAGVDRATRRRMLDDLALLNEQHLDDVGDPEISARITQYEMAFRKQASVPELADLSQEPAHVLAMYGPDVRTPGTYAHNCLMARRLLERGVRYVQLMHAGWDQHSNLSYQLANQCRDTDQPSAALVADLQQRGMLDDTLVVWGGEFGRTVFVQGDVNNPNGHGRDHFGRAYSLWMAGGGVRGGYVHGETDDFAYNVVRDGVHVHDLQATLLHLLGIDHERLTYRYQGRQFRLTDVHGTVVDAVVA
jgi:hypothetical protein